MLGIGHTFEMGPWNEGKQWYCLGWRWDFQSCVSHRIQYYFIASDAYLIKSTNYSIHNSQWNTYMESPYTRPKIRQFNGNAELDDTSSMQIIDEVYNKKMKTWIISSFFFLNPKLKNGEKPKGKSIDNNILVQTECTLYLMFNVRFTNSKHS